MTDTAPLADAPAGPADLAEIFYAPSAVFARRREGAFGLPLVVIVIAGTALAFLTIGMIEAPLRADTLRGLQPAIASGKMTADAAAAAANVTMKFAPFFVTAFFLVTPFVAGLVLWLAGLITRARVGLGLGVMIATFSLYPRLLGNMVGAMMTLVLPESSLVSMSKLSVSPVQFVDVVAHPGLAALLSRLDLFAIWSYALVGIGVYVAARSTKGQAWATAIIAWLILSLPAVYQFVKLG